MNTAIEPKAWREAMGGFLTGVTIVTTCVAGRPAGTIVNAFCAVSLAPPLLLVCLDRDSRTLAAIREAHMFGVNILSARQEGIVRQFAAKDATDRFKNVAYCLGGSGAPILRDVIAWFDCRVHAIHDGGDHEIVLGHAIELSADARAAPLAYHRGRIRPMDLASDGVRA